MPVIGQRGNPRDFMRASSTAPGDTARPQDASPETQLGNSSQDQLGPKRLSPDQERLVQELAQTDQKVRAHEAAHQAAAGSLGGAISFTYEAGPDGKSYAVGGEVSVDLSSGHTPEETLARAEQIRAAALAPADPSPQDLSVAAEASQMEAEAQEQMMQQQLAAMHASREGHSGQVAVLGSQALRGRDVRLSHSNADNSEVAAVATSGPSDVGQQAAVTVATLESDRTAEGATNVQIQRLARLAMTAYGM